MTDPSPNDSLSCYLGIDMGTSGCRAVLINQQGDLIAEARSAMPAAIAEQDGHVFQDPQRWELAFSHCISSLGRKWDLSCVRAVAIDATSGTVLGLDENNQLVFPALMYSDRGCVDQAERIGSVAPEESPARGVSSGLARMLWLLENQSGIHRLCHQADWLVGLLSDRFDATDENNALKTGYDVINRCWPDWLADVGIDGAWLPRVLPAGTEAGSISVKASARYGLPAGARLIAGTTDSIAAFIATGADRIGDAVTSLGSTLAIKLLSDRPVFASDYGIYSHRLNDTWLVGGASNTGGQVLLNYFDITEMETLQSALTPDEPTGLNYYPLIAPGERFPHNDPRFKPRIVPVPENRAAFFQAILEGIADIESQAYAKMVELGAPIIKRVFTAGGGAGNDAWTRIRQRVLGVTMVEARHTQAAYGSALLALRGYMKLKSNEIKDGQ